MNYTRKNCQVAYNCGRDMYLKGWAYRCPYVPTHIYAKFWRRGWYDAEEWKEFYETKYPVMKDMYIEEEKWENKNS